MISGGSAYTCALTAAGQVCWWGYNKGPVGDGTTTNRLVPTAVSVNLSPPVYLLRNEGTAPRSQSGSYPERHDA